MSEVKRYGATCDCMSEMAWGDYVRFSDYDALQSRLDAAVFAHHNEYMRCEKMRQQLAERDAMLRRAAVLLRDSKYPPEGCTDFDDWTKQGNTMADQIDALVEQQQSEVAA